MSIIDELVFDRTGGEYYNNTDLNRVASAVQYLAERLRGYGYIVTAAPKTDWTVADEPTLGQLEAYRTGVVAIRRALTVTPDTPPTPEDMAGLTWREANDMEKILADVEQLINNMAAAWMYSGEIYAGEV